MLLEINKKQKNKKQKKNVFFETVFTLIYKFIILPAISLHLSSTPHSTSPAPLGVRPYERPVVLVTDHVLVEHFFFSPGAQQCLKFADGNDEIVDLLVARRLVIRHPERNASSPLVVRLF